MKRIMTAILSLSVILLMVQTVDARGGHKVRSQARASVNSGHHLNRNKAINRNNTINRGSNINVNRTRNVNVDVDVDHRGYRHGCCYHDDYHPLAVAAAVTATALVIGSIVNTLPPSCSTVVVNGYAYQQCGNTWYQPQISGSSTTYIVVNAP